MRAMVRGDAATKWAFQDKRATEPFKMPWASLASHKLKAIKLSTKGKNTIKFERFMVPGAGIEPARSCLRQILSLVRLPISPPGQKIT